MTIIHFYQLHKAVEPMILRRLKEVVNQIFEVTGETCYNVDIGDQVLLDSETGILQSILKLFNHDSPILLNQSSLEKVKVDDKCSLDIEVGPRLNQKTPFCTNATSICHNVGMLKVEGIEASWRYRITSNQPFSCETEAAILGQLHDPMTQCRYASPLTALKAKSASKSWYEIDVIKGGSKALQAASDELGFGFDDWDVKFYANLFRHQLKRNPTSVECFDLAQSNSEHSRHWFFKAKILIDGEQKSKSLFELVTDTLQHSNKNNKIAFHDNGSAIEGQSVSDITLSCSNTASEVVTSTQLKHSTLTAETHNFPTGVAPFPGATTGTGGRQRDQHAIGRGAAVVAGIAGYCVGNLNIKDNPLPWEDGGSWRSSSSVASASKIIIDASDGASDYGNKFGEPVITGFFRSFGMKMADGERLEWLKPIMFSAGIGTINDDQLNKVKLEKDTRGLLVAKIGGPAYRIGVGGGCASSQMQGESDSSRDFNAVQRGDAEMQQKLNRVIRACLEQEVNPILSIHDQGAGGNGNVLKEIVEPSGAVIYSKSFTLGDDTLNALELWIAEYQESDAILLDKSSLQILQHICKRERCILDVVGELNGSGRVVLSEQEVSCDKQVTAKKSRLEDTPIRHPVDTSSIRHPVDLDLQLVLGKMPQKIYNLVSIPRKLTSFCFSKIDFNEALSRVLKLPSVGSKRFLTNKVDRSVTGLIAQQQCSGPLHTPIADVAVTALSHFNSSTFGTATAIGEQPIKMLVDEACGARMAVGEALTNLVFAAVSDIRDIKCSANWMWPAKLPGEGAKLYAACESMCDIMKEVGIAIDGGKDSLSMAATVGEEIVKCPGSLVITLYAPCVDITCTITPDLKCPGGEGWIVFVPMSSCGAFLGGSALAQCYKEISDKTVDLDDSALFVRAWKVTQQLVKKRSVLAGHDVSDGGLITCVLEMAFAGNCGLDISFKSEEYSELEFLFSEKLGILLETACPDEVVNEYKSCDVDAVCIGKSIREPVINVIFNEKKLIDNVSTSTLRDTWESSSFALEKLQNNEDCVVQEREWLLNCKKDPPYFISFEDIPLSVTDRDIKVAIMREEGSNGDREMAAAFMTAGFQPWDVTMQDLIDNNITLDRFRGLAFVGGFSYADVFGSAKGWAACCLFNERIRQQLEAFKRRDDVFSLGVCNGCQLMALLGWVGTEETTSLQQWERNRPPLFIGPNDSNRYESRFVTVGIEPSNSIMLKGMEGSRLGVWVAHGEGKFCFSDESLLDRVLSNGLSPIRFLDHNAETTTSYPLNPNGSPHGIAGLCSSDGRHLALMPHPERCFQMWQWPWQPLSWKKSIKKSPWLRMFENALSWCVQTT